MRAALILAPVIAVAACSSDAADDPAKPNSESAAMGNDPFPVVPSDGPENFVAGRSCPTELVVDGTGVTWLEGSGVMRAPKSGAAAVALMSIADSIAIKQRGDFVYVAGRNRIARVRTDGTLKRTILEQTDLSPRDIAVDATRVYFTAGSSVRSVPIAGGAVTTLASDQQNPTGLAVDDDGFVYWTNRVDGGSVRRAKVGGSVETFASGQASPSDILINAGFVYWLTSSSIMIRPTDRRFGAFSLASASSPRGLAVDNSYIFWADGATSQIRRVGKMFFSPVTSTVASNEPATPAAVASDGTNVYWTLGCGTSRDALRTIHRAETTTARCRSTPRTVLSTSKISSMSFFGTWFYYAERTSSGRYAIRRVWQSSGTPETLVEGRGEATPLVADAYGIVWAEDDVIYALDNGATTPRRIVAANDPDLMIDRVWIYYTDRTGGVFRVARAGGSPTRLAAATGTPRRLARADDNIYWSEDIDGRATARKVAKTGGAAQTLITSPSGFSAGPIAVDDTRVVLGAVASTSRVLAAPKGGGATTMLTEGAFRPRDLTIYSDGTVIFASTTGADLYRIEDGGKVTVLSSQLGVPRSLDTTERCALFAQNLDDGSGRLVRVSRYSLGKVDPNVEMTWEATFKPLNSTPRTTIAEVSGQARITIRGDQFTVAIEVRGEAPGVFHAQHLHRTSACSTSDADLNRDGYIDVGESLRISGGVIVSLDTTLTALSDMSTYPVPGPDGVTRYSQTVSLSALENAIDEAPALTTRSIQLHGVEDSYPFPASVAGIEGVPPKINIPIACAVVRRVK